MPRRHLQGTAGAPTTYIAPPPRPPVRTSATPAAGHGRHGHSAAAQSRSRRQGHGRRAVRQAPLRVSSQHVHTAPAGRLPGLRPTRTFLPLANAGRQAHRHSAQRAPHRTPALSPCTAARDSTRIGGPSQPITESSRGGDRGALTSRHRRQAPVAIEAQHAADAGAAGQCDPDASGRQGPQPRCGVGRIAQAGSRYRRARGRMRCPAWAVFLRPGPPFEPSSMHGCVCCPD